MLENEGTQGRRFLLFIFQMSIFWLFDQNVLNSGVLLLLIIEGGGEASARTPILLVFLKLEFEDDCTGACVGFCVRVDYHSFFSDVLLLLLKLRSSFMHDTIAIIVSVCAGEAT